MATTKTKAKAKPTQAPKPPTRDFAALDEFLRAQGMHVVTWHNGRNPNTGRSARFTLYGKWQPMRALLVESTSDDYSVWQLINPATLSPEDDRKAIAAFLQPDATEKGTTKS